MCSCWTYETVLSRRRRRCVHEFATTSRRLPTDSIDNLETGQTDCVCVCFCVLTTWILIDTDNFFNSDDIMTSLLKKLSIFIKIGVIKRYRVCLMSFKIVDRIRRQSSSASCELCTHRRRDETRQFRRVGVGGVYWALRSTVKFDPTTRSPDSTTQFFTLSEVSTRGHSLKLFLPDSRINIRAHFLHFGWSRLGINYHRT